MGLSEFWFTYGDRERQRLFIHSATLTHVCHFDSSSKSRCKSVEHISASLRCAQKESEQSEAFKRVAKQLIARKSASELLNTLRASGIMDCRRFISASGLENIDEPASAGMGSKYRLRSVVLFDRKQMGADL